MDVVKVNLFGSPQVTANGDKIFLPTRKTEALFYYLVVNKQATRDELATLLWGEYSDRVAKKYLRNAMYRIRKAFGIDVVISPQKHIVIINPKVKLDTDLDIFLYEEPDGIKSYSGEFLRGFLVKDAENFVEWTRVKADFFRELYVEKLYRLIQENLSKENGENIEHYAKLIIRADEFDERVYRILMKFYADKGAFNKAINIYKKLSNILEKELSITPDANTKDLYSKILEERNSTGVYPDTGEENFFYGRQKEMKNLQEDYKSFVSDREVKSVMIIGEAGIGKTKLKDEFLRTVDSEEVRIFKTECFQAEERYLFKPWNNILSEMGKTIKINGIPIPLSWSNIIANLFPCFTSDFTQTIINPVERLDTLKLKVIEDTIISVLERISEKRKILLIFEDIQWIDRMSLSLLSNILFHGEKKNIFFIGTLRIGYSREVDKFITLMSKYDKLKKIEISRFTRKEVDNFVAKALPGHVFSSVQKDKLYEETEGNAFFLIEYLNIIREKKNINMMTSRMQDILKSRIIDISEEGKKVLNIISLFFDEISLDILKNVSGKNEFKIMDIIEELKGKFIIKEISESEKISYRFTHHKLREYIYSNQSLARRRILHNKIGLILEGMMKNDKRDILLYPNLIYHFSNAKNRIEALRYSIKNAKVYMDFSHELFPDLRDSSVKEDEYLQITKDIALKYMDDIESLLKNVKSNEGLTDEVVKLEVEFLHMKGRYLIREGEYDSGIRNIRQVIENSLRMNDLEYAVNGYIQMIFYAIQIYDVDLMEKNLKSALRLARSSNYQKGIGILLRLKGLNKIMTGCYEEAEELLKESIEIFSGLNRDEDKYSLSIAAAYSYLGEIRKYNLSFFDALNYYDKAISISSDKKALSSLAIFNTNAGQAAFDSGDFEKAKQYLREAIKMYDQYDTYWGHSTAEGYNALLFVKDGRYDEALESLKRADEYSKKLKSPYELGLVFRVKAEIKSNMKNNSDLNGIFKEYLDLDINEYCSRGIKLLEKTKKYYEVDLLNRIKQ